MRAELSLFLFHCKMMMWIFSPSKRIHFTFYDICTAIPQLSAAELSYLVPRHYQIPFKSLIFVNICSSRMCTVKSLPNVCMTNLSLFKFLEEKAAGSLMECVTPIRPILTPWTTKGCPHFPMDNTCESGRAFSRQAGRIFDWFFVPFGCYHSESCQYQQKSVYITEAQ